MTNLLRTTVNFLLLLLLAQPVAASLTKKRANLLAAAEPLAVKGITLITDSSVAKYSRFEAAAQLNVNKQFTNPNDPAIIDIKVVFISPSEKQYKTYAFYMIPYTRNEGGWQMGSTDTPWHVRFSPNEAGTWRYSFTITDSSEPGGTTTTVSPSYSFTCTASAAPGFLTVAKNKRYLEFSEGKSFFGIGEDLQASFNPLLACDAPSECPNGPCYSFLTQPQQIAWIKKFHANGGNLVRIWVEPYSYEFEWEKLGDYLERQNRAADMDELIEQTNQLGMYIHLVLCNSRALSSDVEVLAEGSGWRVNPYKKTFGLSTMDTFYTDARAVAAYKNRLRYIQSRWGYSPAIASYSLMNEPELPSDSAYNDYYGHELEINVWFANMARYLKQVAYPPHLVSVDYTFGFNGANKSPEIDFTSTHYYSWDKLVNYQRSYITQHHTDKFDKPYVQTEFGIPNWMVEQRNEDVRQAIWSSALSGSFSTAFFFGADVKYNNSCWGGDGIRLYGPLSKFLAGEAFNNPAALYQPISNAYSVYKSYRRPLPGFTRPPDAPSFDAAGFGSEQVGATDHFVPKNLTRGITTSNRRIEVFALRSPEKILGWVHDRDYYWYNLPHASNPELGETLTNRNVPSGSLPAVTPLDGQTMTINGLRRGGVYNIQWYSANYQHGNEAVSSGNENGGLITDKALGGSTTETAKKGVLVIRIPRLQPTELQQPPFAPDYGFKITPQ